MKEAVMRWLEQGSAKRLDVGLELTDAELVREVRAGRPWAQEQLYRKYVKSVAAIAVRLFRDPTEAQDVVQDTFMEAFTDIEKLRNPGAVGGWLRQIAAHQVHPSVDGDF